MLTFRHQRRFSITPDTELANTDQTYFRSLYEQLNVYKRGISHENQQRLKFNLVIVNRRVPVLLADDLFLECRRE